nr:integrase, catalytic region, zinc finger, CCHC-type, peptidase aspartic, catalytic [Tanacetum cinerariifolium]
MLSVIREDKASGYILSGTLGCKQRETMGLRHKESELDKRDLTGSNMLRRHDKLHEIWLMVLVLMMVQRFCEVLALDNGHLEQQSDWAVWESKDSNSCWARETVGNQIEDKGVSLSAKQGDWLDDTDEEPDEQEPKAHYIYVQSNDDYNVFATERQHSEQPETINDKYVMETINSNVIPNLSAICDNDGKADQNAKDYDNERVVLANLKLETDENKKIQKQLKIENVALAHELKECKSALEESNDIRDRCRSAIRDQEIELEKYKKYKNVNLKKKRDLVQGNITIKWDYYVEGLNHNLFSVGQFGDADLEVAFRKSTCFVRDLQGNDLVMGVIYKTSVSRPKLRSTQLKEKVVQNNSQVKIKWKEVEDHHRIYSLSNKTKSVTTCNGSLKSRTSNVKDVYRTIILFIVDSRCTKLMMGNLKLLCNFVEKYLCAVWFGNDQFAPILGYRDLVQGNITIKWDYYVEGLNHNLFSVGQFGDADFEVAFRKSTCFVRDL